MSIGDIVAKCIVVALFVALFFMGGTGVYKAGRDLVRMRDMSWAREAPVLFPTCTTHSFVFTTCSMPVVTPGDVESVDYFMFGPHALYHISDQMTSGPSARRRAIGYFDPATGYATTSDALEHVWSRLVSGALAFLIALLVLRSAGSLFMSPRDPSGRDSAAPRP